MGSEEGSDVRPGMKEVSGDPERQIDPVVLSGEQQRALLPMLMVGLTHNATDEVKGRVVDPKDRDRIKTAKSTFMKMARNIGMEFSPTDALRLGLPDLLTTEQLAYLAVTPNTLQKHAEHYLTQGKKE